MRLVTRADLDGLASALILARQDEIDEVQLVHPQAITDKQVEITSEDILANLPYHPACGQWFDHHLITDSNETPPEGFKGRYGEAPSAAQLVWDHFGRDPQFEELVQETNRLDSAQLSELDVLQPQGYILLGFTLDPSTGLGTDQENDAYFHNCLEGLQQKSLHEVILSPAVGERIHRMFRMNEEFCSTLVETSLLCNNVIFTDFRMVDHTPVGNRFLVYTLFPEANVSVRVQWARHKRHFHVHVGHSIFNRTCRTRVGELMSRYGGGGHVGAGSTPLPLQGGEQKIFEIIETLQKNG